MATGVRRDERLEARISSEEKELIERAATARGVSVTDFVISSVHAEAIRAIEERHTFDLSQRDQRAFVHALLNPEAPNEALLRAAERHGYRRRRSVRRVATGR